MTFEKYDHDDITCLEDELHVVQSDLAAVLHGDDVSVCGIRHVEPAQHHLFEEGLADEKGACLMVNSSIKICRNGLKFPHTEV